MEMKSDVLTQWTRPGATLSERLFIGVAYLVLAAIFLLLQISVFAVFISYSDYRRNICYRIMTVISAADSIQLLIHCYGGFITIFNSSFSATAEKILGGVSNSICITLLPLGLILSLNRLLVFHGREIARTTEFIIFNSLILVSFIWGACFLCIYMTPYCGIAFRDYAWNYDETLQWSEQVRMVDEISSIPMLVCTFFIYLGVLGMLVIKRRHAQFSVQVFSTICSNTFLAPHELRLLVQSLVHFLLATSLLAVWHLQFALLPESPYSVAAVNYYWILYNGINPLLYLSMNSTLRKRMIRLVAKKKISSTDSNIF